MQTYKKGSLDMQMGVLETKQKKYQLSSKIEEGQQNAKLLKAELKHSIKGFLMIFLRVERFYWYYFFYILTVSCETIVMIPFDFISSILNIGLINIGYDTIKRTSLFACMIMVGYFLVIQDYQMLDVSSLYHFFRGQTTVKLYSAGLSIQIFQKVLTMTGKTYLSKLPRIFINTQTKASELKFEIFLSFLYVITHFFILYIDFILFVIVINSSANSRILYLFITNLGKLKAAVFKKFEKKSYKSGLIYDSKDRFYKITYGIIFMMTMEGRVDDELFWNLMQTIAVSSAIDYLRHLCNLSLGGKLLQVKTVREIMFEELYLKQDDEVKHINIMKCLEWDFTVIPYILFTLKFVNIIIYQIKRLENYREIEVNCYLFLVAYVIIAKIIIWFIRKQAKIQKSQKQDKVQMGELKQYSKTMKMI